MAGMKISNLDFVRLLPAFMRDDEAAIALSKAMNELIGEPGKRLKTISTWGSTDELTEAECDELAWELDIDWYDSTGMSLEEKQATIKLAQQIKRKRGTKWAVERLISAYFGEGYLMEWYDMDYKPFTFVVLTTNTHITAENYLKFVEAVKAAKNERSRIMGVFYFWQQGPDPGVEYALGSGLHRYDFKKCGISPRIATIGFAVKSAVETEPDSNMHKYRIEKCSETDPKTAIALSDVTTEKTYFLYVSEGRLYMSPTNAEATRKDIIFRDGAADINWRVYISAGKLRMTEAPEGESLDQLNFVDHTTGVNYYLCMKGGGYFVIDQPEPYRMEA